MDNNPQNAPHHQDSTTSNNEPKSVGLGMQKDTAATLAYGSGFLPMLGWVTGLLMLFLERDPYVRFHSYQSVAFFGIAAIVWVLLDQTIIFADIKGLLFLVQFVVWLLLLYRTFHGNPWVLPVIGKWARDQIQGPLNLRPKPEEMETDPSVDQRMGM